MTETELLRNVSDTAKIIAYYRAQETDRPDALFRDPYARRLAGDRGEAIVRASRSERSSGWAIATRTCVFDEIILQAVIKDGVDTVVNLAAGLDTRPYRLPLPKTLRWIEVDLPPLVAAKEEAMKGEVPRCKLERIAADLAAGRERRALFERLGRETKHVLVVTEGLLMYLDEKVIEELAADLLAVPSFEYWLADVFSPKLMEWKNRDWAKTFGKGAALFRFGTNDPTLFFARQKWKMRRLRFALEEARRLRREMPMARLMKFVVALWTQRQRQKLLHFYTFVLLQRAGS